MRSRACSSDSPHSFHAYTASGLSLELAIASASASILALSLSSCGLVTISSAVEVLRPRRPLWVDDMPRLHAPRSSPSLSSTPGARHSRDDKCTVPQSHSTQKTNASQGTLRSLAWAPNNQVPSTPRGERFDPLN